MPIYLGDSACIVLENTASFLQPTMHYLEHLHFDHCHVACLGSNTERDACVLSVLRRLRTLRLISVTAGTTNGGVLHILDLSGCQKLQLHCSRNNFLALKLSGCGLLKSLNCKHGRLRYLTVHDCWNVVLN